LFDSGVGGLSLLGALRARLPGASIHYVADSAHAPYGELDDDAIVQRSTRIAAHLVAHGAQLIVVACNTATAVAVAELRRIHAALPIVGIEPGLKPALARTRSGRVGIMATSATLRSPRFRALLAREGGGAFVHLEACAGLAAAIEHGEIDDPLVAQSVERHSRALREAKVDCVALGCTHYPFVRAAIEQALGPGILVIDTADAVAAQVERLCDGLTQAESTAGASSCLLETTGDADRLRRFAARWLPFEVEIRAAPAGL
jgi:glutamate racemase